MSFFSNRTGVSSAGTVAQAMRMTSLSPPSAAPARIIAAMTQRKTCLHRSGGASCSPTSTARLSRSAASAALSPLPDDLALVEHDGALGELERDVDLLLDEQHRDPAFAPKPHQRRGERVDDHRRQSLERLVEQQELGIAGERAAHRQHLLLAARELVAVIAPPLGEAREEIVDALERPFARARRRRADSRRP